MAQLYRIQVIFGPISTMLQNNRNAGPVFLQVINDRTIRSPLLLSEMRNNYKTTTTNCDFPTEHYDSTQKKIKHSCSLSDQESDSSTSLMSLMCIFRQLLIIGSMKHLRISVEVFSSNRRIELSLLKIAHF